MSDNIYETCDVTISTVDGWSTIMANLDGQAAVSEFFDVDWSRGAIDVMPPDWRAVDVNFEKAKKLNRVRSVPFVDKHGGYTRDTLLSVRLACATQEHGPLLRVMVVDVNHEPWQYRLLQIRDGTPVLLN